MKVYLISLFLIGTTLGAKCQTAEMQQLLLNYEKLTQLKNILTDMKKGYLIVSKGYNTIKDISEGNFNLHDAFMNGLITINPAIKNYKRVADILKYQKNILSEYKNAFSRFKNSGTFSPDEITYLGKVYSNLFKQSLQNLDELVTIITSTKLSMSDDERLEAIDRIFKDTEDKLQFLRDFNRNANILSLQRNKELQDIKTTSGLFTVAP